MINKIKSFIKLMVMLGKREIVIMLNIMINNIIFYFYKKRMNFFFNYFFKKFIYLFY